MKRRDLIGGLVVVPVLEALGRKTSISPAWDSKPGGAQALRVVHLTDTHVFDDRNCPALARECFRRIREVAPNPDLVLHSGDVIMDALLTERSLVARQWQLWKELEPELPAKPRYAIGNHDVWGQGDPATAKDWAIEQLGMPRRYYRFDQGGWRFIVLDSPQPKDVGWYTARIDEEQLAWLEAELRDAPAATPIAIMSHIPILSVAVMEWAKAADGNWSVSSALMHADSHEVQRLLRACPNVKLCLSGHLHLQDRLTYDGIDYLGAGAVCGDWWKADTFHQTHCGFATLELEPDGTYRRQYFTYQWT